VALMQMRATPIDSDLSSPAELLLCRPITTLQPSHADPGQTEHRQHLETIVSWTECKSAGQGEENMATRGFCGKMKGAEKLPDP